MRALGNSIGVAALLGYADRLKVHTLYNLGVSLYMRGDYRSAAQQFDRAEREGADIGDLRWQAGLFAGMGMSYSMLDDFEAAVSYLRKSEALELRSVRIEPLIR